MNHNRQSTALALLLSLTPTLVTADWKNDIAWPELQTWAAQQSISLPHTGSIHAGQVEAGTNYMIDTANAQFSEITNITNVSNSSSVASGHATGVGGLFFGKTNSISTDIDSVYVYSVDDFVSKIQNPLTSWPADVMCHAYVSSTTVPVLDTTILTAAFDSTTTDDNVLHVVGANNGASANVPQIWSYAYNNISVGRTDGLHSAGTIAAGYEGAGRQKPEIVNSLSTTSSATGATSSAAALLLAEAKTLSSSASLPVTIKSCLLAGATKEEFPSWDNTATRPIDEVYGAGEVNILNSFRMLEAGEQSSGNVNFYGWDNFSPQGRNRFPQSYTFTVPAYASSASLCANLSWNRSVLSGTYTDLADLSLTLTDGSGAVIFKSDSPVDNLEHIWQTNLAPGSYTLTADRTGSTSVNYTLAWRVDVETDHAPASFTQSSTENSLTFENLIPNHSYTLERSSDLTSWTPVTTLTASATGAASHSDPNTALGEKVFYRLSYFTP